MALKCSSPNHWVWLGLVTGMGLRREDRTVSQTVDCVTPTRKGASFLSSHGVSCVLSLGFFLFVTQSCAELWFWDRIGYFKPRVQRYSSKLGFFFFFFLCVSHFHITVSKTSDKNNSKEESFILAQFWPPDSWKFPCVVSWLHVR